MDTAGIAVIQLKKGAFIALCHSCDQFVVIQVCHSSIVSDLSCLVTLCRMAANTIRGVPGGTWFAAAGF